MEIKGTAVAQKQPNRRKWVKGQGFITVESWESNSKSAIEGKEAELIASTIYSEVEVIPIDGGLKWSVEASTQGQGDGSTPEPTDIWELDAVTDGADLINHPAFASMQDNKLRIILDAVKNPLPGQAPALGNDGDNAVNLYMLLMRGVTSFNKDVPVLRHTQTPAVDASVAHIQDVWTQNQLPSTITPGIATLSAQLYANNPYGFIGTAEIEHTWGWLKLFPKITEDVNGRSQMVEEWMLSLWPKIIYNSF